MMTPDIECVLNLSPLQKGMLFHSVMAPEESFYFEQVTFGVSAMLKQDILKQTWEFVGKRHQALRTAFIWEQVKTPVQVVFRHAEIPVTIHDWSRHSAHQQRALFAALLQEDRRRGFELRRAPLFRVSVLRVAPGQSQMVISFHHAILDGWSLNRLFREFGEVYREFEAGRLPHMAPAPKYADFIAWHNGRNAAESERFWRRHLQGYRGRVPLPMDRRAAIDAAELGSVDHLLKSLSPRLSRELQQLARRCKVTLNVVLQVAWAILLSRLTKQEEATFGIVVSGRPETLDGVEEMIGLFINTVPLRIALDHAAPIQEVLKSTHALLTAQREHEHCALSTIHQWSDVPNGEPMFDTLFIFENLPGATKVGTGQAFAFERTNYPVTLLISPGSEIGLKVIYETPRIDRSDMQAMIEQYISVLEQIGRDPTARTADIHPRLAVEKLARLPGSEPAVTVRLEEIWAERVAKSADKLCVIDRTGTMTVGELDRRAMAFAAAIIANGIGAEDIVAVDLERSADLIASMLGILKVGAAFLLIDRSYPPKRRETILREARPACLVTDREGDAACPVVAPTKLMAEEFRPPRTTAAGAAFMVFTSGSTGRPKGVVQTHQALANRLMWMWQSFPANDKDVCAQKTSPGFVDVIAETLGPVLGGTPLAILSDEARGDAQALARELTHHRVSRLVAVPSLIVGLLDHLDASATSLPDLRLLVSSGEALSPALAKRVHTTLPEVKLLNLYGSSEVCADATFHVCNPQHDIYDVPIGREVRGFHVYLLDDDMRPVVVGAVGEIFVSGCGLARGYRDQPGMTAERFLPDPLGLGERMYRTGDLGRRQADGAIIFCGRVDHQIGIRGLRIEPEEIESVLCSQPPVEEAVVFANASQGLIAAVVARAGGRPDPAELRQRLASVLPRYMVPDSIVTVKQLPRLPNGKTDRKAIAAELSLTEVPAVAHSPEGAAPLSKYEQLLGEIWSELLRVPLPTRRDGFFALGGHSIIAMQLSSRVLKLTGISLPLRVIFERPNLSDMAGWLEHNSKRALTDEPELRRTERKVVKRRE